MKKRFAALMCAMALFISLFSAHAINAGDVYFTAVNDKLIPLSLDTMPTWVGGRLYVPASTFDSSATGVDLGFFFRQNNNTVTLYTLRQMLVFDLNRGIAYDRHTGEPLSVRAVNRNGRIYLPVETVCDFFGLEDSYNYTQHGYLIRIKNDNARLNDADFIDAGSIPMSADLQEFLRAHQTQTPPSVPPSADPPSTPDSPTKPEQEPEVKPQQTVYLAFRCESGEGLHDILSLLERRNIHAMFFFSPQLLTQQDDLIRQAVGSGHSIGLLAQGSSADESRQALADGNRTLSRIARTAATAALAPSDQRTALQDDGWACWNETANAAPQANERSAAYTQRILRTIGTRRTTRLTLTDSRRTAQLLPSLLDQLTQEEYRVLLPVETQF